MTLEKIIVDPQNHPFFRQELAFEMSTSSDNQWRTYYDLMFALNNCYDSLDRYLINFEEIHRGKEPTYSEYVKPQLLKIKGLFKEIENIFEEKIRGLEYSPQKSNVVQQMFNVHRSGAFLFFLTHINDGTEKIKDYVINFIDFIKKIKDEDIEYFQPQGNEFSRIDLAVFEIILEQRIEFMKNPYDRKEKERLEQIRIEHYEVFAQIGSGMGRDVYKARNWKDGYFYALKIDKKGESINRKEREEYYEEGELAKAEFDAARKLTHKNITRAYARGTLDDKINYFIEEYIDGISLEEIINREEDYKINKEALIQIIEGVSYLHQNGYVHRDLKPSNILIPFKFFQDEGNEYEKAIRIADLELARHISTHAFTEPKKGGRHSAPELVEYGIISPAGDVFSLGIIFYQTWTREHPFLFEQSKNIKDNKTEIEKNILNQNKYSLLREKIRANKKIPEVWKQIIIKCLEYNRENRYQNAEEILLEIKII